MQFTITASFFSAALAAASPATSILERQAGPSVNLTFYSSNGCNRPGDIITPPSPLRVEQDTEPCHELSIPQAACTALTASTLTRRIRVYEQPGCPEEGGVRHFDFPDNNVFQFNQRVQSYKFLAN